MTNIYNNLAGWLIANPTLEIVVRPYKSKRSHEQNNRLWKLYEIISDCVYIEGKRYSQEVWHEHFKRQFLGCDELQLPNGTTELRGKSTTRLKVDEMAEYQNKIQAWAATEHGVEWGL